MASSVALDESLGSVTTSFTSNSRAFAIMKQTFSGEIDRFGAASNMAILKPLARVERDHL